MLAMSMVSLVAFVPFNRDNEFPEYVSGENVRIFNQDFIRTVDNQNLRNDIQQKFGILIDQVNRVDAQYAKAVGYYYLVLGTKNNEKAMVLLKVKREDIEQEQYTYIKFKNKSGLTSTPCLTGDSHWVNPCPWNFNECKKQVNNCIGLICSEFGCD